MNEFKSSNPELSAGPLNYSEEVKKSAATKLSSEGSVFIFALSYFPNIF